MSARSILLDTVFVTEELVTSAVKATGVTDEHVRWTEVTRVNFITVHLLAGRTASTSRYGTVPLIYRCYLTMPDRR
jgi:hypothetical protein